METVGAAVARFRLLGEFRIVLNREGLGTFHPGSDTGRNLCVRAFRSTLG